MFFAPCLASRPILPTVHWRQGREIFGEDVKSLKRVLKVSSQCPFYASYSPNTEESTSTSKGKIAQRRKYVERNRVFERNSPGATLLK